jgi:hypothetical protein
MYLLWKTEILCLAEVRKKDGTRLASDEKILPNVSAGMIFVSTS